MQPLIPFRQVHTKAPADRHLRSCPVSAVAVNGPRHPRRIAGCDKAKCLRGIGRNDCEGVRTDSC